MTVIHRAVKEDPALYSALAGDLRLERGLLLVTAAVAADVADASDLEESESGECFGLGGACGARRRNW